MTTPIQAPAHEPPIITAQGSGLRVQLSDGREIVGGLSEDGATLCFALTAINGAETRIALSHSALAAMRAIQLSLLGLPAPPSQDERKAWIEKAMELADAHGAQRWATGLAEGQRDNARARTEDARAIKARAALRTHLAGEPKP